MESTGLPLKGSFKRGHSIQYIVYGIYGMWYTVWNTWYLALSVSWGGPSKGVIGLL